MTEIENVRLPQKRVKERYGVSDMTLWRWERRPDLQFPKPLVINGRKYWRLSELQAFDKRQEKQVTEAAA